MSVRDTSLQVYFRIKEDGTLSRRRWEVYDIVFNHGPITGNEIFKHCELQGVPGYRHNVHARLTELREMGVVKEAGTRECQVTGETAIIWDVTSNLPTKLEKKKSAKQQIKELSLEAMELRAENAHLKALLEQRNAYINGNPQGSLF